jgi:hypothetical protein
MSRLWLPGEKKEDTKSYGFPPAIMAAALGIARHSVASAEMPKAARQRKRKRRLDAKRARRKNR